MSAWLALDTASTRACVAVVDPQTKTVLSECGLDVPRRHAESIAGAVDGCLSDANLRFADLDGFAAGVGPGSFVGVRVAIATAKGFALARSRPLMGFCSLHALGGHAAVPVGRGLAVIDARRSEVYVRPVVKAEDGEVHVEGDVVALSPQAASELHQEAAFLVGSGASLCAPMLSSALSVEATGPDGAGLLAALTATLALEGTDQAATLVPNYCRPPDAKRQGE